MKKTFSRRYPVRYHDVDFRGKALALSIVNFFQDAAGEHAARLGFSVPELMTRNLTWLLSRYHVKFARFPEVGETAVVTTWPSGSQGIFALRDFIAKDGTGAPLAAATSSFVLWDLRAKRPASLDEHLPTRVALDRRALADDFPPLPPCDGPADEIPFRIVMQDIDFNNHVNHATYIHWALESPPEAVLRSRVPVDIEIAYRAEAFYGDEIVARIRKVEGGEAEVYLHGIFHKFKGTELARLRTTWQPA